MFGFRYLPGVVTLTLDIDRCDGCGMCVIVCPHAVFAVDNGKSRIVDGDGCMECGACARNCHADALSVRSGVGCAAAVLFGSVGGDGGCCANPRGCAR